MDNNIEKCEQILKSLDEVCTHIDDHNYGKARRSAAAARRHVLEILYNPKDGKEE